MHHIDAPIDEAARKADLVGWYAVAPIASPVC